MGSSYKINWENEETFVPLNPKQNPSENQKLLQLSERFPMQGHIWIASSGSSAGLNQSAKLLALSKKAFLVSAGAVNSHLQSDSKDIWLQALPEFHVGGLSILARAFLSGSQVVGLEKWDANTFHSQVTEKKVTLSALVPTQVFDLVQARLQAPSNLRAIVIGGSALSDELYNQALEFGWPLLPSYGMTECCSQVATATLEGLSRRNRKLKILSHIEAKIEKDHLQIRSEALFTGVAQWKNGKALFTDPKTNGWYQAEDLCEISDGYLTPLGRGSEFVKISGEGVSLLKLQQTLESLAQTHFPNDWKNFAIAVLPDPRAQFQIVLVSSKEGFPVKTLADSFNSMVAPYERIKDIRTVREIPRTDLGKLSREKLNELISR